MTRPRLLDLFCSAGGASVGYFRAGFDVVGVDIRPQPHYPYEFIQADALEVPLELLRTFDAVHASPPCQYYSTLRTMTRAEWPALIAPVRDRLRASSLPYVIENVIGARSEMISPTCLCGSMFGLGVWRHRLFESSFFMLAPSCDHAACLAPIDVTGSGGSQQKPRDKPNGGRSRKPVNLEHARAVMGIDWMSRAELSESIPPAYTEFVGRQLLGVLPNVVS